MKKIIALMLGICLFASIAMSQTKDSKFGVDSAKTIENASIYTELVKQGNYEQALPYWRYVFLNAPALQVNTYVYGEKLLGSLYLKTKNKGYKDTLMMVYDQRIKYFSNYRNYDRGYILGKKGTSMLRFSENLDDVKAAYAVLSESFELKGIKSFPPVIQNLLRAGSYLFENKAMTQEEYIHLFEKCSDVTNKWIQNSRKGCDMLMNKLNAMFFDAGIADCNVLGKMLRKKFEANKGNVEVMKNIESILARGECQDLPLYTEIAEGLYKAEPDAHSAYVLAMMFGKRRDFDKMEKYLLEAIDKSTNDQDKAEYFIKLAYVSLSKNNFPAVKKYALKTLQLNPKSGVAYILIGRAYALYSKNYGSDSFEHASVYWAAVDKFKRAKAIDPSVAAEANKLISTYSAHFPSKDEGFFREIHEGHKVKIGDWIQETTVAHYNK